MRLRIGTSTLADPEAAIAEAARSALTGCASPAFALVLATFEYDAEGVARAATRELAVAPWTGVATPAILAGRRVIPRGVAVGVLDGEMRVGVGAAELERAGPREAGRSAAREALAELPLPPEDRSRALLLFADTAGCDVAEVVHGALSVAGAGVAWCGGGAGPAEGERASVQFARESVLRAHAVAVAFDVHARVGVGIEHGWQPTGPPAMVTRVTGCLVEQLEHRPAFEIYRAAAEDVGEEVDRERFAKFAMTHPLGIPQADGEYLIRDPLTVEASGALRFLASVPDGALVRVMEGTCAMLIEAGRSAASMAREDAGGALGGALVFDCITRYLMLEARLEDELSACQDALGADVPLLGCLTYGEVGAFGSGMPQFHNKTMVVLALPA
jgi:hypothetical protein